MAAAPRYPGAFGISLSDFRPSLGEKMVWLQFMGILLVVDNYNRSY
jgi:hypothetical protein